MLPWPTHNGRKASIPGLLLRLVGQWRFLPAVSTDGRLTLFLLPTYSPELNPTNDRPLPWQWARAWRS
jgi:hypothetical protein